ncbi:MAG: ATP-binding protein [Micromonosporaceae bacterium]|nr:ATP-binding protein [Micromonosporaceae bacterium]
MLPAEPRLPEARGLVERGHYFVLHAPRQTGKTTTLAELARALTAEGRYAAIRFSCETAEVTGDDYVAAQREVLGSIAIAAQAQLPADQQPPQPWPEASPGQQLLVGLRAWAAASPLPVVLFFDEIDALRGESLRSVLRQLRDGYTARPAAFPHSVALCGLRDVRDYKAAAGGDPSRLGTSSPFNIKIESLRLSDFTADQVADLYGQRTAETGQSFTEPALERSFEYTRGQPWLVNALAREFTEKMDVPPATPITAEHVAAAKERLILARATHLDSLLARLTEPRVRKVIEPLIAGELTIVDEDYDVDVAYLRDLGLLAPSDPEAIANPIYREVIVRVLGASTQRRVAADPRSFVRPDGRLDFDRVLREFAGFWRENGEVLTRGTVYHEVAPQLVFMAYCQRIVNGGGYVDREYGLGYRRIDLLIRWPYPDPDGTRSWQREAVELKVWRPQQADPTPDGLRQLDEYLKRLDLDRGTLVVFDRRPGAAPLPERVDESDRTPSGRPVTVLRA